MDLSKQEASEIDPRKSQEIKYVANYLLETIDFYLFKKKEEIVFDFSSQGTTKIY